jgi:hypothetical protein
MGNPTMTGLMDSIIKEMGATRAHKAEHSGAYALKTAAVVAARVQESFPDKELKVLKVLFYSRRAVISAHLEKKALEASSEALAV